MGDLVYLDQCNKRFVDKYTKPASVNSKQSTDLSKLLSIQLCCKLTMHTCLAI